MPDSKVRFNPLAGIGAGLVVAAAAMGGIFLALREAKTEKKTTGLGEEYRYELGVAAVTDPRQILYEQTGVIETGLRKAAGVAVGPGDKIVAVGDRLAQMYSASGVRLGEFDLEDEPRCVTVSSAGVLFIGFRNRFEARLADGELKMKSDDFGPKAVLTSLAVGKNELFAADAGNRIVWRCDAEGKIKGEIGRRDEPRHVSGFVIPSPHFDLALTDAGLLKIVNPGFHRIETFQTDGTPKGHWGRPSLAADGFSGCCNPAAFALLPDGGFVTAEKGLPRVKIYDAEGVFVGFVAGAEEFAEAGVVGYDKGAAGDAEGALDVAADSQGRILVLEPRTGRIRVFTRRGAAGAGERKL